MHNISSPYSLLFRRCAAFLYDCLLLLALFFIITTAAIALNDGEAVHSHFYKLFLYVVAYVFFDWFWRHGGQTLGMRAWRIQLQDEKSQIISSRQTIARYLTGSLMFGITLLYMLFSADNRALHDKLSKTIIVKYNN